jgi:4-hydroxybenzoate polyprenyltransferase
MKSILKYINGFSIDVALGAVVFSNALAFYFGTALPFQVSLLLFCAVWVIYTLDHLLDAKSTHSAEVSFRHSLHARFSIHLSVIVGIATLISGYTLFFVDEAFIWIGLSFSAFISLYLYLNYKYCLYAKELIVAVGYTFGILLGVLIMVEFQLSLNHIVIIFQIFLIAFLNLVVFAFIEYDQDARAGFSSLAITLGRNTTSKLLLLFTMLFFLIQVVFISNGTFLLFDPIQIVLFVMVISLYTVYYKREELLNNSLYRILGDGIFFLPGFIFIFK